MTLCATIYFVMALPLPTSCATPAIPSFPAHGATNVPTNAIFWPDVVSITGPAGEIDLQDSEKYGSYQSKRSAMPLAPNTKYYMTSSVFVEQITFTTGDGEDISSPRNPSGATARAMKYEFPLGGSDCGDYSDFEAEIHYFDDDRNPVPEFFVYAKFGYGLSPLAYSMQLAEKRFLTKIGEYDGKEPVELYAVDAAGNVSDSVVAKVKIYVDNGCSCTQTATQGALYWLFSFCFVFRTKFWRRRRDLVADLSGNAS